MIDALSEFCREYPAWVGPDGYPLSWRHYVYGVAHLGRARAAESLRLERAVAIAQAADVAVKERWLEDQAHAAGIR